MKRVRRIVLLGVLGVVLMILAVIGLGLINSLFLPNLLCEIGFLSPRQAGGIQIPLTTVSVRMINVVEWVALIGVIGSFFYITVINFERYSTEEETPRRPNNVPRARPAPAAQPESPSPRPAPPGEGGGRPGPPPAA